jgi:predicted nucleotidyltransferase component of viral defense system
MIHTSRQLKALVRNKSGGDSSKAQIIIRNYCMERFLERVSLSKYKNRLILKGGILVSSMVGLDRRSTMDIDATIRDYPLTEQDARNIVSTISQIEIEDGMTFIVKDVYEIMDEVDYTGIRVMAEAILETMVTPLKLDFSAGDVITPREVVFSYKLMFEDRNIELLAYNIETILAEKLETILSRGTANTRMRDFYDVYVLTATDGFAFDKAVARKAFLQTAKKRGSTQVVLNTTLTLCEITNNVELQKLWSLYQNKFDYAKPISWHEAVSVVLSLCRTLENQ